jgi:hypothetical protein
MIQRYSFRISDLEIVQSAESFYRQGEPPIGIGDQVILNSGGPIGLVVDAPSEANVVVAWPVNGAIVERQLSTACVHRPRGHFPPFKGNSN